MHARLLGAVIAALCLIAGPTLARQQLPALARPDLFMVIYEGRALVGLVDATQDRAACKREAAGHTASLAARGEALTVRCEVRGPNDMIWKLHPEWRN